MHRLNRIVLSVACCFVMGAASAREPIFLEGVEAPTLQNFRPLPGVDAAFSAQLAKAVEAAGLDQMTPAADNPDGEDEWSSICLVDLSDPENPRVAGWRETNFVYPASTYKMYVMGEAIRQMLAGEFTLDDLRTVKEHNVRVGSRLVAGQEISVSEILRLTIQYSDNAAANEAIDLVDRRRVSTLMRALGCEGSEVTRKYLSRSQEDKGYADIVSTTTNALHLATFLWAVETGAIGGGQGRGFIKGYLAMDQKDDARFPAGLPATATVYSKTGWWNIFTSQAAIIEEGDTRYILCVLTALTKAEAEPKMAELARQVHAFMANAGTDITGESAKNAEAENNGVENSGAE